jgi:hypothetical protein
VLDYLIVQFYMNLTKAFNNVRLFFQGRRSLRCNKNAGPLELKVIHSQISTENKTGLGKICKYI